MEHIRWCPDAVKHALNGMTYARDTVGRFVEDGMCLKWPDCDRCRKTPKDLLEARDGREQG